MSTNIENLKKLVQNIDLSKNITLSIHDECGDSSKINSLKKLAQQIDTSKNITISIYNTYDGQAKINHIHEDGLDLSMIDYSMCHSKTKLNSTNIFVKWENIYELVAYAHNDAKLYFIDIAK